MTIKWTVSCQLENPLIVVVVALLFHSVIIASGAYPGHTWFVASQERGPLKFVIVLSDSLEIS